MSHFLKKATNPRTGKEQVALFHDNYFRRNVYGIIFRKDGKDMKLTHEPNRPDYEVFSVEQMKK